jgi:hypothetical protein
MTKAAPGSWGRFYHPGGKVAYHIGNSIRGVRDALRKHYKRIDLDFNCDIDGNFWNIHWNTFAVDGFKPKGNEKVKARLISGLDRHEVAALRAGTFRVNPAEVILPFALKRGLTVEFEAKGSRGFNRVENWERLAAHVGTKRIVVKTLTDIPGWRKRLKAAHAAGFTTMALNHDGTPLVLSAADAAYIDYVRGKFRLTND